jgi:hypothetical protein
VPWSSPQFWGDYEGISGIPGRGSFIATWADNRDGSNTQVFEAIFHGN